MTKKEDLSQKGTLNPHPEKVKNSLFTENEFFDPQDLVQVKYEMLRSVEKDGNSVSESSKAFGLSRPSFYRARSDFEKDGIAGLTNEKPGPREARKLDEEIMQYIEDTIEPGSPLRARSLVPLIEAKFGIKIHSRSIERAFSRRKKK